MSKDLFKEAIADARAVREAALANAKAALEESMTPRLQSMIAAKLQEMEEIDENIDEYQDDEMEESQLGFTPQDSSDEWQDNENRNGALDTAELEEDFDLSEILAELNEEETLEEAKKKEEEEEEEEEESKEESEDEESSEEESSDEEEVDLSDPEQLKAFIVQTVQDTVGQMDAGAEGTEGEEVAAPEAEMNMEPANEEEPITVDENEEVNLEELLAELDSLDEGKKKKKKEDKKEEKEEEKEKKEKAKKEKELDEALKAVNTLKAELNEVNLLNAKLIYVNKLFKGNLTESQKVEILASFDKATTLKEAKMLFESLSVTLAAAPKRTIKESLGFASKPMGVAPAKKMIVESDDVIARMQKLANIK